MYKLFKIRQIRASFGRFWQLSAAFELYKLFKTLPDSCHTNLLSLKVESAWRLLYNLATSVRLFKKMRWWRRQVYSALQPQLSASFGSFRTCWRMECTPWVLKRSRVSQWAFFKVHIKSRLNQGKYITTDESTSFLFINN